MKSYSRRDLGRGLAGAIALSQIAAWPSSGKYAGPPWYDTYAIGGTNPYIFADPTTEGTTNHYLYNGTVYGSFSALLTAAGGSYANSTGKYVTNSSGLLSSVAANTLPFNHDASGNPLGLLLEGASTNYCINSANVSTWDPGANISVTSGASDPTGGTNASTITATASGGWNVQNYVFKAVTVPGAGTYTNAYYLRRRTGSGPVYITAPNGGPTHQDISGTLTGSWQRFSIPSTVAATAAYVQIDVVTSGDAVDVFGTQTEPGSFASSYIPTTSSTASRAADSLYIPWTATTFTARVKATLAGEVDGNYLADTGHGLLTEASGPNAQTSNGTQTLTTGITAFTSSNIIVVGGSGSGRVLSANGNTAASDSNALVPSAGTEFYIGQSSAGANQANGNYAQIGLWTVAATAAQAATNSGTP